MSGVSTRTRALAVLLAGVLPMFMTSGLRAADSAVASVTSPDGKVRIDILSLKRSEGETVTLRLSVSNDGTGAYHISLGNLQLIDLVGRRSYGAGLTGNGCDAPAGERLTCWAMFAEPPKNLKTISIKFYEQLDMISGVPITE